MNTILRYYIVALAASVLVLIIVYATDVKGYKHEISIMQNTIESLEATNNNLATYTRGLQQDIVGYKAEIAVLNTKLTNATKKSNNNKPSNATPAIYNLPLSASLQKYTYDCCVKYGIPELYEVALAVMWQESDFTVDTVSPTEDYGIMQINICNHDWLRDVLNFEDIMDVNNNIRCGVYMLSILYSNYGDVTTTLIAYNRGQDGVAALHKDGIYTTEYSDGVQYKLQKIKAKRRTN